MANTSSRTLRLLSLLQHRPHWSGADLADRLDVSVRTLRRDVDRLRSLGYPIDAQPGVDGGYQLTAGAALPPLVLDDDEAIALVVGLYSAVNGAVADLAEPSIAALAKVVNVMPARLRRRVDALRATMTPAPWTDPVTTIPVETITEIALASRNHEHLTFAYRDRSGAASERRVEPHRIVMMGRRWYLAAYDTNRSDWRTFRVDRISDATTAHTRFHPREVPGGDAAAYVEAGLSGPPTRYIVEALVDAPADTIDARINRWGVIEPVDGGRCRVTMASDSLDWPAMTLGSLGADFTVIGPAEFTEHLRALARQFEHAARPAASAAAP